MFWFALITSLKVTYIKRHLHDIKKKKNRKKYSNIHINISFDPIPTRNKSESIKNRIK